MMGHIRQHPQERLIEEIRLENGLLLRMFDHSRRVAGDRWYVKVVASVDVPVERDFLKSFSASDEDIDAFMEERGETCTFIIEKERNFIDEKEREEVLNGILRSFKASCVSYMGRDGFGPGVLKKEFKDFLEKRGWWKDQ